MDFLPELTTLPHDASQFPINFKFFKKFPSNLNFTVYFLKIILIFFLYKKYVYEIFIMNAVCDFFNQ